MIYTTHTVGSGISLSESAIKSIERISEFDGDQFVIYMIDGSKHEFDEEPCRVVDVPLTGYEVWGLEVKPHQTTWDRSKVIAVLIWKGVMSGKEFRREYITMDGIPRTDHVIVDVDAQIANGVGDMSYWTTIPDAVFEAYDVAASCHDMQTFAKFEPPPWMDKPLFEEVSHD